MKKLLAILMIIVILVCVVSGCNNKGQENEETNGNISQENQDINNEPAYQKYIDKNYDNANIIHIN